MKKLLGGVAALLCTVAASAAPLRINDTYVGSNDHGWGDLIGNPSLFQVSHMNVDYSGNLATVTVFTNYSDGTYGTTFGDLFISNNGWAPFGSAPYMSDNASNGEVWEYVFDTSEGKLYGGDFAVLQSQDMGISGTLRSGQEVLRRGGGKLIHASAVQFGSAYDGATGQTWNTIAYQFDWTVLGIAPGDDIGLRWEMTCANDAIEGEAPTPDRPSEVPLPGSALLLGAGLLAMRGARKLR